MHAEPRYWWHWWAVNARWWWRDVRVLVRETVREFGADQCPHPAASISYYVLFSIFPLALLFLAISGLNRGGDRTANQALWRIVMVRMVHDPRTRRYVERRTREGRSKREIIRSLKRYVARQLYRHLPRAESLA